MKYLFALYVIVTSSFAQEINLAKWMEQLAHHIQDKPISKIAMPGCHDAATHTINSKSVAAHDEEYQKLRNFRLVKSQLVPWSKAQNKSIYEQLKEGARYLDFRVCYNPKEKKLFSCHGLEGQEYEIILKEVRKFLDENPKEVVIIDFQHFYHQNPPEAPEDTMPKFFEMLKSNFGDKALLPASQGFGVTLKQVWDKGKQVIVVSSQINQAYPWIWHRRGSVASKWHDKADAASIKLELDKVMRSPPSAEKLFVLQAQLTPDASTIAKSYVPFTKFKSLEDMAKAMQIVYPSWIQEWAKEGLHFNVFLVDFMNAKIAREIIQINIH